MCVFTRNLDPEVFQLTETPPAALKNHPMFTGACPVGVVGLTHPQTPPTTDEAGLVLDLDNLGLLYQKSVGRFSGKDEEIYIIYGCTRDQVVQWGRGLGQVGVIYCDAQSKNLIDLVANRMHPALPAFGFSSDEPPSDNFIELPTLGFLRLHFNQAATKPIPNPLFKSHHHHSGGGGMSVGQGPYIPGAPDASQWLVGALRPVFTGIGGAAALVHNPQAKPKPPATSRHSYPLHDAHTDHHPKTHGPGVMHTAGHFEGRLHKSDALSPISYTAIAQPFGSVDPLALVSHNFYSLKGRGLDIDGIIRDNGHTAHDFDSAPTPSEHNYNTRGLSVHSVEDDEITNWRKVHELAHSLTHQAVNIEYGEGKRVGQLGRDLSLREALRAVAWEYLAMAEQRVLLDRSGIRITDAQYAQDLNTVVHDVVYRVVSGRQQDPEVAGFQPYTHIVPQRVALDIVRAAAARQQLDNHYALKAPLDQLRRTESTRPILETKGVNPKTMVNKLTKREAIVKLGQLCQSALDELKKSVTMTTEGADAADAGLALSQKCEESGCTTELHKCDDMCKAAPAPDAAPDAAVDAAAMNGAVPPAAAVAPSCPGCGGTDALGIGSYKGSVQHICPDCTMTFSHPDAGGVAPDAPPAAAPIAKMDDPTYIGDMSKAENTSLVALSDQAHKATAHANSEESLDAHRAARKAHLKAQSAYESAGHPDKAKHHENAADEHSDAIYSHKQINRGGTPSNMRKALKDCPKCGSMKMSAKGAVDSCAECGHTSTSAPKGKGGTAEIHDQQTSMAKSVHQFDDGGYSASTTADDQTVKCDVCGEKKAHGNHDFKSAKPAAPAKKGEDFIDTKNDQDHDKRIKPVGMNGKGPDDRAPVKVGGDGNGGDMKKSEEDPFAAANAAIKKFRS